MLNEYQINALPERIYERLSQVNMECLEDIGRVIGKIGELRPKDVHQLQQAFNYGADIDKITAKLTQISGKNVQEIYDIFDIVAKENYDYAKPFYKAKNIPFVPYEDNESLQRYVKALAKQTAGEYINLTQTTAFAIFGKDGKSIAPLFASSKDKIATSLSDTYTKLIDYAVTKVQTGQESYAKAMQDVMRSLVNSGIKTVDYASDYSRRLDSSVKQNILWGIKQCNQNTADLIGEEFGADGYEVSYHSNPAPDHEDMGGRQYAKGKARTVNGAYYPSFEQEAEQRLKRYGCLHFKFSILLGISQPAYSEEQLTNLKANDRKTFEFEGKPMTMYDAQQLQNKTETAIKRQKELANMAKEAGDDDLRREAQYKLNLLTDKYAKLCQTSGLPTRMERIKVAGFRNVKAVDKSAKSGIIRTAKTTTEVKEVQYVGKIDKKLIEKEFGKIQTDEVVLTGEREAHIKDGHLIDFELFEKHRAVTINSPDIVLKDVKNANTIFMVKRLGETNINIVVKIAVVGDEKHPKNSIMTSYRIRNRNLKKLEEKNKVLYKSE